MKEYTIIGAGPAGICALAKICSSGVSKDELLWIDSQFNVGDFGTSLSIGSSIPGNTSVESYNRVNHAIYTQLSQYIPGIEEKDTFQLKTYSSDATCPLKIAAAPLQSITNQLLQHIPNIKGQVLAIEKSDDGLRLSIRAENGKFHHVVTKRVILATGSKPKTIRLPSYISIIPPNIAFIESELQKYINEMPIIKNVAVIGSSHSAALATMHLLKTGLSVKQFMNKPYLFASREFTEDGQHFTKFDNTGLKGEVALFTTQLLNEAQKYQWEHYIRLNSQTFHQHLSTCSHAVAAIGYTPSCTLTINGIPLSRFKYDSQTTQMISPEGKIIPGVFGIGIAYPRQVKAPSGEIEFAVGVEKFWVSIDDNILMYWKNYNS